MSLTKVAPALAARAVNLGARGIRNTAFAPMRATQAAQDILNRARGINPEDYNSDRNKRRRALGTQLAEAQQKFDDAKARGDTLGMTRAQVDIEGIKVRGQAYGTGVGSPIAEAEKRPKIDVKLVSKTFASAENEIAIPVSQINIWFAAWNPPGANKVELNKKSMDAELLFTVTNTKLLPNDKIEIGKPLYSQSRAKSADFQKFNGEMIKNGSLVFGEFSYTVLKPGNKTESKQISTDTMIFTSVQFPGNSLSASGDQLMPDTAGTTYNVRMRLALGNMFGGVDSVFGMKVGEIFTGGILSNANNSELSTEDRMFKIVALGFENSAPVKIKVRIDYTK